MSERETQGVYPNYYPNPVWLKVVAKLSKRQSPQRGKKDRVRPYDACAICKHLGLLETIEQTLVPSELVHVCKLILKHSKASMIPVNLLFAPVKCGFFEEIQFDEEAPRT